MRRPQRVASPQPALFLHLVVFLHVVVVVEFLKRQVVMVLQHDRVSIFREYLFLPIHLVGGVAVIDLLVSLHLHELFKGFFVAHVPDLHNFRADLGVTQLFLHHFIKLTVKQAAVPELVENCRLLSPDHIPDVLRALRAIIFRQGLNRCPQGLLSQFPEAMGGRGVMPVVVDILFGVIPWAWLPGFFALHND